jgi:hypothetical protein
MPAALQAEAPLRRGAPEEEEEAPVKGVKVVKAAKVVCRCGKVCRSFTEWDKHLKAKHPKWRAELEGGGDLADDRKVFRESRGK